MCDWDQLRGAGRLTGACRSSGGLGRAARAYGWCMHGRTEGSLNYIVMAYTVGSRLRAPHGERALRRTGVCVRAWLCAYMRANIDVPNGGTFHMVANTCGSYAHACLHTQDAFCMHVRMHTCTHSFTHARAQACRYAGVQARSRAHLPALPHICMHACACVDAHSRSVPTRMTCCC